MFVGHILRKTITVGQPKLRQQKKENQDNFGTKKYELIQEYDEGDNMY